MAIKEYIPINWALIGNPVNWIIVIAMFLFAGLALAFILPGTIEEEK